MKTLLALVFLLCAGSAYAQQPNFYGAGLVSTDGKTWMPVQSTQTTGSVQPNGYLGLLGFNSATNQWYPCSTATPCTGTGGNSSGGGTLAGQVSGPTNATVVNTLGPNVSTSTNGLTITNPNSGNPGLTLTSTNGGSQQLTGDGSMVLTGQSGCSYCGYINFGGIISSVNAGHDMIFTAASGNDFIFKSQGSGGLTDLLHYHSGLFAFSVPTAVTGLLNSTAPDGAVALNQLSAYCQTNGTNCPAASKVVTGSAANTDTAGTVILASGTTASPAVTFTGTYASNPVCTFFTQNATTTQSAALGTIATQVSTTATSASVSTAPAANITLGYICIGRS